jgi:hypothetical protein
MGDGGTGVSVEVGASGVAVDVGVGIGVGVDGCSVRVAVGMTGVSLEWEVGEVILVDVGSDVDEMVVLGVGFVVTVDKRPLLPNSYPVHTNATAINDTANIIAIRF